MDQKSHFSTLIDNEVDERAVDSEGYVGKTNWYEMVVLSGSEHIFFSYLVFFLLPF